MFYFLTISGATLCIALADFVCGGTHTLFALGESLSATVLGVAAVIAVDGIFALIIRRLPERAFAPEARLFSVSRREQSFYRRIKINKWKQYVPEWGCFTGFHKDRLRSSTDAAYLGRFLLESNYGVAGHLAGAVFGFLILLLPFLKPLSMAIPIAAVNFVLSLLPAMILRFNTPALRRLYRRMAAREEQSEI